MITLITGTPGAGKTLYMVSQLAKSDEFKKGRKVFVDGIKGLLLETDNIPDGHSIHDMHIWLKDEQYHGSIVIIDEAQRIFPPRSSATKAPEVVDFLHIHRHYGIDFYLITQMPKRIDSNVRDLVGAHYHIYKNKLGMRTKFYWDYCANNPKIESKDAQASLYKLDESAYDLYKSAEVHTKIKQPITRWVFAIPVGLLLFLVSAYIFYSMLHNQQQEVKKEMPQTEVRAEQQVLNKTFDAMHNVANQNQSLKAEMFVPTLAERPESKPIYDSVRQVKQFERIAGCVDMGNKCTCYSDQATKLKEITTELCRAYVKDGLPFDPFRDKPAQTVQDLQQKEDFDVQNNSQVAVMGGQVRPSLSLGNDTKLDNIQ